MVASPLRYFSYDFDATEFELAIEDNLGVTWFWGVLVYWGLQKLLKMQAFRNSVLKPSSKTSWAREDTLLGDPMCQTYTVSC